MPPSSTGHDTNPHEPGPTGTRFPCVIWGAGGLAGAELLRLVSTHPALELIGALSRSQAGRPVSDVHPALVNLEGLYFTAPGEWSWEDLPSGPGIVFAALAHGETMHALPPQLAGLEEKDYVVVDLSGDFRLDSPQEYQSSYGREHTAAVWLKNFVYGLTEFNRPRIRGAVRVANPGCFATGAQLALLPLATLGVPVQAAAIDGKTGSSGAGLKPGLTTHHPLRAANCEAYKLDGHAHLGEILASWRQAAGNVETEVSFVPHRTPMVRGIYTTVQAFLESEFTTPELLDHYQDFYAESPLVRLLDVPPSMNQVAGTCRCDVSVVARGRQVVICTAIDNLLKGAASQAIQNANLMLGLDECAGLLLPPPWP